VQSGDSPGRARVAKAADEWWEGFLNEVQRLTAAGASCRSTHLRARSEIARAYDREKGAL
jgi:hypothetical protein